MSGANPRSGRGSPSRPLARRVQARAMRFLNVPMRLALSAPFPTPIGRRLMLVTLTGRRTGRIYRQPVSYVRDGDTLLTPGGGRWTRNLITGRAVPIRLRGRMVRAWPEVIGDLDQVAALLPVIAASNPAVRRFIGMKQSSDGTFDRDQLSIAVQHGFCIVRWHLNDGATEGPHSDENGSTTSMPTGRGGSQ